MLSYFKKNIFREGKYSYCLVTCLCLFLVSYIPLFHKLTAPSIYGFDETLYATNSVETTFNNNFIVLTENNIPSIYNTKPALVIWAQSLCMRIFGISELSVRLPSALAALFIVFALYFFSLKIANSRLLGCVSVLVFLTSNGFINFHISRTGDLDSMLSLWIVLYSLSLYKLLLTDNVNSRHIFYWIGFYVIMAFLSKSIAGFMFLPGLIICTLISERRKEVLKNRHLYYASAITIAVCAGYYFLREILAPGYLKMVWGSEIMRFTEDIAPYHQQPFFWFIDRIIHESFLPYVYLLPVAVVAGLLNMDKKIKLLTIFIVISCSCYLFFISYPTDKLFWYDAPLYPFFSILIGILFFTVYQYLKLIIKIKNVTEALILLCLIFLFYKPYIGMFKKFDTVSDEYYYKDFESRYIKNIHDKGYRYNYKIYYKPRLFISEFQVNFYRKAYDYNEKMKIGVCDTISDIHVNDTIMVCQPDKIYSLNKYFNIETLNTSDSCSMVIVTGIK